MVQIIPIQPKYINRARPGQGMVEFALAIPILLLLIFGVIEFGRLIFCISASAAASREGARYGAASGGSPTPYYKDCPGIRAATARVSSLASIAPNAANILISYENMYKSKTEPSVSVASCDAFPAGVVAQAGSRIVITVKFNYSPLILGGIVPSIVNKDFITRRTLIANLILVTSTP